MFGPVHRRCQKPEIRRHADRSFYFLLFTSRPRLCQESGKAPDTLAVPWIKLLGHLSSIIYNPSTIYHLSSFSNLNNLFRLIRQIRPKPLFDSLHRHSFALCIIFDLVAFDVAKVEVFGFRMGKIESADG